MLSEYGVIALFIVCGALFVLAVFAISALLRPYRPNMDKNAAYECAEESIGNAWTNFNIRFYIVALIFVLFEAEIIFLFPWASVYANPKLFYETNRLWAYVSLVEIIVFVVILSVGLAYAWAKGYLDWVKPDPKPETFISKVPQSMYQNINEKYKS